jgi:hypothetical protein
MVCSTSSGISSRPFPPTARPYWPAEPVPAALALIASELSLTAMALFLAGMIAVEAGVSAACGGGGRPLRA